MAYLHPRQFTTAVKYDTALDGWFSMGETCSGEENRPYTLSALRRSVVLKNALDRPLYDDSVKRSTNGEWGSIGRKRKSSPHFAHDSGREQGEGAYNRSRFETTLIISVIIDNDVDLVLSSVLVADRYSLQ